MAEAILRKEWWPVEPIRCPLCGARFPVTAPGCPQCGAPNGAFSEIPPGGLITDVEPSRGTPHIQPTNEATGYIPDIRLRNGDRIFYYPTWTLVVFLLAVYNVLAALLLLLTIAIYGRQWGVETADWVVLGTSGGLMVFYLWYGSGHLQRHKIQARKQIGVRWYQALFLAFLFFGSGSLVTAIVIYISAER